MVLGDEPGRMYRLVKMEDAGIGLRRIESAWQDKVRVPKVSTIAPSPGADLRRRSRPHCASVFQAKWPSRPSGRDGSGRAYSAGKGDSVPTLNGRWFD